ncbi:MAG: DNA repair protein RecN [Acidobacteriota bacterium]
MLTLLNISNIALIDDLQVEFERGLNLLTGETGSGKSIIVDALGTLIGGRFSAEMIKAGAQRASIEGQFLVERNDGLEALLDSSGIELNVNGANDIIIRREMTASGRNKIFVNNQLATLTLLKDLRAFLVDIHGQGEQQTLFSPDTHLDLLDAFANTFGQRQEVANKYKQFAALKREIDELRQDEAKKYQLIDILRFQIEELQRAQLEIGEDERLEEERKRLNNVEKLTTLSSEAYGAIYEDSESALGRMKQATRRVEELAEYDSSFRAYLEGLQNARAVLEDLAFSLRDFADGLEFSPERLSEVENRLAEISRLKRKYGGTLESALAHLEDAQERLNNIEHADQREQELQTELAKVRRQYLKAARDLHGKRQRAAEGFEKSVVAGLAEVAMENSRFEVRIVVPSDEELNDADAARAFTATGIDRVEFYFSANVGEDVRPLAKVASGGEASRLMLVLKTIATASEFPRTIVFDEIDTGIGGRVSEAVGVKLKKLSASNQVLCVTHQPQIARFADAHLLVQKEAIAGRTVVNLTKLDHRGRVEELARMLTGAEITDTARRHAREMLKA